VATTAAQLMNKPEDVTARMTWDDQSNALKLLEIIE
jgi:hypothetical protein